MKSALYEGEVLHQRHHPRPHRFRYRLFLMYLDLDELPRLFDRRWFWSSERPNLLWFRRADYLGPSEVPLRTAVLDRVESELGRRPTGPVRLVTHLRTFGFMSNPVSFYLCHAQDETIEAIVAEITNTPWGERHAYVLDARDAGDGDELCWRFRKQFHISPFCGMNQDYEWRFGVPGERLAIRMRNRESGQLVFEAGLACSRRSITSRSLAGVLLRHPLMTLRVHLAIYWQAARLFFLRTPFFTHPDKREPVRNATRS